MMDHGVIDGFVERSPIRGHHQYNSRFRRYRMRPLDIQRGLDIPTKPGALGIQAEPGAFAIVRSIGGSP